MRDLAKIGKIIYAVFQIKDQLNENKRKKSSLIKKGKKTKDRKKHTLY